jgi:hypothetical protein
MTSDRMWWWLRRVLVAAIGLALLLGTLLFGWPTRYRYDHMTYDGETVIVRIDRLTGDADMLLPDQGWTPVEGYGDDDGARTTTRS